MNIEESIKILNKFNKIKINSYAMQFVNISYPDLQEAIETLLIAYEKEKAKVERIKDKLAHLKILAKIENKDIDRIKELEILLKEE